MLYNIPVIKHYQVATLIKFKSTVGLLKDYTNTNVWALMFSVVSVSFETSVENYWQFYNIVVAKLCEISICLLAVEVFWVYRLFVFKTLIWNV